MEFPPTVEAFASCIDGVDSSPNLELFNPKPILLSGILRYFLELKTPGSDGSDAAHQM